MVSDFLDFDLKFTTTVYSLLSTGSVSFSIKSCDSIIYHQGNFPSVRNQVRLGIDFLLPSVIDNKKSIFENFEF